MMMLDQIDLRQKRVIIRCDFNVPMHQGHITSDTRIRASLDTIACALNAPASVLLLSHLGQPREGVIDPNYSLAPIARHLSGLLGRPLPLLTAWPQAGLPLHEGEIALAENTRFLHGETTNCRSLSQQMAKHCDVFIMDAFACAHRTHASTHGLSQAAPIACAGYLFEKEVSVLKACYQQPARPNIAILGGAKGNSKIEMLTSLIPTLDCLVLGGGIANTFLSAQGYPIGQSLYNPDQLCQAKALITLAAQHHCPLILPQDVVTQAGETTHTQSIQTVKATEKIVDIGPKTCEKIERVIGTAKTILWNGPMGWFERKPFDQGTQRITQAIAHSSAYSIAGGGDTISAIESTQLVDKISYISTGGGAFLAYLQHKSLPIIDELNKQEAKFA